MSEPEEVTEQVPEYSVDIGNLPRHKHIWIMRGAKVSCEGAGHPHHSHFLTTRKPMKQT
jgi:hypothetical protein